MFEQTFRNIDDVLWKEAGCSSELDYVEQTSWMLFLKYLDDLERDRANRAELVGEAYEYIIDEAHRWSAWAAPKRADGRFDHDNALTGDDLIRFVNDDLFPYLKGFRLRAPDSDTLEYKIGEIFGEIRNKFRSGYSLRDALELIDTLRFGSQKEKHELSQLYEEKIQRMGNAGRNGGEYYTPRPLIRAMVRVVNPEIGETIYDGAVGSAGFLCEAHDYLRPAATSTRDLDILRNRTFYGKEKKSLAYVIAIMNMILHGIETPNIVHQHAVEEHQRHPGEGPLFRHSGKSPVWREGAEGGSAELPDPDRGDGLPLPPALHQVAQGWRARGHRHQEYLPLELRQRLARAPGGAADELQPAHDPRLPERDLPGRGGEDGRALLRQGRAHPEDLVLPARPRPQPRQNEPAQR